MRYSNAPGVVQKSYLGVLAWRKASSNNKPSLGGHPLRYSRSTITNESARLLLTPRKVEASTELRPSVAVSKEIGNCASAKVAENAHWPPQPRRLEAAAIAECEERVSTIQHVVRNKHIGAVWSADKCNTPCCVKTWQVDLQVVVAL